MARSLSNMLLKGLAGYRTSALGSRSLYQAGNRYLSSAPNDPDTHEDFRPTSKVESSGISLKDTVEQDVKDNPVMLYMKGVPDLPRCGFSSLAVRVLQEYNVPISARNILDSYELKDAVKSFSHWPTFPQIFINGEFIGGSDIILSMHQSGELKEKLKDIVKEEGKRE
ncbi:PREDICTED: monothiol glutaredoxin-S15, mitochondrial-like isoform X2 [Ipomoea nil]|nr:PREDICTED: monothiol glutaredoxin-S15, mitochondrial-like isoform X2 [Ipomoea nil]XP_019184742.1 PREDICTED: monothiol glutaredoxin-S15, mitochondrial-like isoform X2 [Ipomoea nil]XP_019184743.1 PREDICTED: monothiol glutaredoxin-S15, mitochondrial-like isoform X2 [Ipomoea nil]